LFRPKKTWLISAIGRNRNRRKEQFFIVKTDGLLNFANNKTKKKSNMAADKITTFDVLIEIPRGSRNKYEYDFEIKRIRFDRMLFSSMMYPADYGFFPETLALDGDPLDVLVLINEPTFPGCVMEVKPIGVFHMADDKGSDDKIICVPVSDPIWSSLNNLSDINKHLLKEIEHFFQVYKDLENKVVDVEGWGDVEEAFSIIQECTERFEQIPNKPKGLFSIK
jgi:inorganic pyrophosphatase